MLALLSDNNLTVYYNGLFVLFLVAMAATLLQVLGLIVPDTCPRTLNNFYPSCWNYKCRKYDFVIVGGGTAGCVLANRLTENPNIHVLLLEDGNYPSRISEIPLDFLQLQETEEDWAFKAEQLGLFKGSVNELNNWPQGRALGGSSSINAMIYSPGVPYDYDLWATHSGDQIWAWDTVRHYFKKLKQYVRTTYYTSEQVGRLLIGIGANLLGIPVNDTGIFGYKDHPVSIDNNTRFSMAEAYLKPIMKRPNLCVMVNRHVNKIIIEGTTAIGVEVQDPNGVVVIKAKKEVIVSAGAINSPKLLMLSGIGPRGHLTDLGISVYADLPVGKNLEDHLIVPFFVTLNDIPMPLYSSMYDLYCASGLLLNNIGMANFLAFFNTKGETNRPDLEFIHFEFLTRDPTYLEAYIDKFGIIEKYAKQLRTANQLNSLLLFLPTLLHPISRGELLLQDLNPKTPPRIFPHYLEHDEDKQVFIDSINKYIKPLLGVAPFMASELFRFAIAECDQLVYASDEYWKCYFTYFAGTIYHPSGTCKMGTNSNNSVVNSRLKVWGVTNLRVVDSSTFSELPSGHNNIPTCMLAENAADIIKVDNSI